MNELPISIKKRIARYEEITFGELTLYPVRVESYDEFLICKPALEVMHQSLKVKYMRMPLLSALYQMDFEAGLRGETPTGLFSRALLALALSLRLGEGKEPIERVRLFQIATFREEPTKLMKLRFFDERDGKEKEIEPTEYKKLREIIAAQNGVRLESDSANPDIVQAKKDMGGGGANLDYSVDALKSFAAAMSKSDESDIDEWPILKLTRRTETYQTMLAYLVCGIGEASGASWKTGNPYPHPIFRRTDDGEGLAKPMKSAAENMKNAQTAQDVLSIEAQINNNKGVKR